LQREVCRLANVLRHNGVRKGDRVAIYMPMIPEAVYAMLACARLGAVHNVVFAGFSAESLRDRINDARCTTVITADEGVRGGKLIPLKRTVDEAVMACPTVRTVFVARRTGNKVPFYPSAISGCARPWTASARTAHRAHGQRGHAVPALHLGQHRQAQGRGPHHGGLPAARRAHPPLCLRLPRRRHLRLRGRRGLDHRAFLRRLRAALQWRDHAAVRERADLSGCWPLLGLWWNATG
jgi:hypothetical protein